MKTFLRSHKKNFIAIFILTFVITTYSFVSYGMATSSEIDIASTNTISSGNTEEKNIIESLGGAFAPYIAICQSPLIALTALSGFGSLINEIDNPDSMLNSSRNASRNDFLPFNSSVDSGYYQYTDNLFDILRNAPLADTLKDMPLANPFIFFVLAGILFVKFALSVLKSSKVLCDATLGQLENWVGIAISTLGVFLIVPDIPVQAAELTASNPNGILLFASPLTNSSIFVYLLSNIISFILAALSFIIYITMKTIIFALDILAFLFSRVPGMQAYFTTAKHFIIGIFTVAAVASPTRMAFFGIVILLIAFYLFERTRRLELYYRKIYIIPFYNAIFRRKLTIPIVPDNIPKSVEKEFNELEVCLEAFMMNKKNGFYKRELCYFIRDNDINYVFKKRLFKKMIKIELDMEPYVEKCFRFMRIFTDENLHISQRKISLVIRREHNKNIPELVETADLIDYNELVEERKREKAAEKALAKAEQKRLKDEAIAEKKRLKEEAKAEKTNMGDTAKSLFGKLPIL